LSAIRSQDVRPSTNLWTKLNADGKPHGRSDYVHPVELPIARSSRRDSASAGCGNMPFPGWAME
jgi:hypothetical protein